MSSIPVEETTTPKLNRIERIKKEKDPFEIWAAIERYAVTGFESIEPDDLDLFKWYGIYTQRPANLEASRSYFMLRIKLPNGDLNVTQLRTIASLTQRFAQSLADITDRQNFQLHWVQIENIPTISRELEAVGISLKGSSGDTVRNVIGCPLAGYDPTEIINAWPLVEEINRTLAGNSEFGNLPRKFKISISGCVEQCAHPEINDLGLVGVRKNGEVGFEAWIGGGLGSQPQLGQRLGVFIPPSAVVEVAYHSIAIFRDHGYRKNRAHARLKFLVEDWGVEKFRQELEKRLGYRLEDSPADYQAPANAYRDHIGAYPQKDGRYAIGLATLGSRVTAEQLFALADLAEHYGSGHLRTTTLQNVVILDIPAEYVEEVKATAAAIGLPAETSNFRRGLMSCTGNQFCKQAVTETKNRAVSLIETLERELPNFPHQLSIGLNGCPNSCTRYQVADIGLVGSLGKPTNNPSAEKEEVFQIYLGGRLGDEAQLGHHLKQRVRAEEVQAYVVDLLKHFEAERSETETFTQYANRKFVTEK